ncbi:hypothetical protein [Pseudomonas fragariae (ex Marin et al. 2024)]|mgnify:CR=1 FL=1|uniref:hypothetical protein n=1 Tax=Pseudomonas fragariae (ex Marin et al. 2024) TaxID=3080056 RepID=UPI003F78B8C2
MITSKSTDHYVESGALLLVLLEPPSLLEEEFNDWYDYEHFPQRLSTPGFINGQRWVAIHGWPRYLARYTLENYAIFDSAEYRAISGANNSPWSKRILPRTIGRQRLAAQMLSQKASNRTAISLGLITWPLDDPDLAAEIMTQASVFVSALPGVIEYQWAQTEGLLVYVLGFDHVQTPDMLASLARIGDVGASKLNVYVRYTR